MRRRVDTVWFVRTGGGTGGRRRVSGSLVLDEVRNLLASGEKPSVTYVVAYAGDWDDVAHHVEVAIANAQVAKTIIDEVIDATYDPATAAAKRLDAAMHSVVASLLDDDFEEEWLAWEITLDPEQIAEAMCRAYQVLHGQPDPDTSAAEALDRRIRSVS